MVSGFKLSRTWDQKLNISYFEGNTHMHVCIHMYMSIQVQAVMCLSFCVLFRLQIFIGLWIPPCPRPWPLFTASSLRRYCSSLSAPSLACKVGLLTTAYSLSDASKWNISRVSSLAWAPSLTCYYPKFMGDFSGFVSCVPASRQVITTFSTQKALGSSQTLMIHSTQKALGSPGLWEPDNEHKIQSSGVSFWYKCS